MIREVREESGIEVYEPRFVTSQPWPFPSSLMLGFAARSDGGEPVANDGELEDVAWFPLPGDPHRAAGDRAAAPPAADLDRAAPDRALGRSTGLSSGAGRHLLRSGKRSTPSAARQLAWVPRFSGSGQP